MASQQTITFITSKSAIAAFVLLVLAFFPGAPVLPVILALMMASGAILLITPSKTAPSWWYPIIGVLLAMMAWFACAPDYFMDFTTPRGNTRIEVNSQHVGRLFLFSKETSNAIILPLFMFIPFTLLGAWDRWLTKINPSQLFLAYVAGITAGICLSFMHP